MAYTLKATQKSAIHNCSRQALRVEKPATLITCHRMGTPDILRFRKYLQ